MFYFVWTKLNVWFCEIPLYYQSIKFYFSTQKFCIAVKCGVLGKNKHSDNVVSLSWINNPWIPHKASINHQYSYRCILTCTLTWCFPVVQTTNCPLILLSTHLTTTSISGITCWMSPYISLSLFDSHAYAMWVYGMVKALGWPAGHVPNF